MADQWTPLARLSLAPEGIYVFNSKSKQKLESYLCLILEIYAHYHDTESAFSKYNEVRIADHRNLPTMASLVCLHDRDSVLLIVGAKVLVSTAKHASLAHRIANLINKSAYVPGLPPLNSLVSTLNEHGITDVTEISRCAPIITRMVRQEEADGNSRFWPAVSFSEFMSLTENLSNEGLLTVAANAIDFGDFKRYIPFCPDYGYSRGTPIDRYYLDRFVTEIKDDVIGVVLEVGGLRQNRQIYGFYNATLYRAIDIAPSGSVDMVGDVHDPRVCKNNSLDRVILFNVLEHCAKPWIVIENIHKWLKRGGKVVCAVPNAQRIHRDPADFWRIQPDGLRSMFSSFEIQKLKTYGNLLTAIASLSGIGAEELIPEELEFHNEQYPVISCLVGRKT
jgi:SAM-dependent methyltransferase